MNDQERRPLGMVVAGSLSRGVKVRLNPDVSVEEVKVGTYLAIQGRCHRFLGMVADIHLESMDPRLSVTPPDVAHPFIARAVAGTTAYGSLDVVPRLVLSGEASTVLEGPQPAKTIPPHFSRVFPASPQDMERVFGREDRRHFYIGNPLDMEVKVCLDLEELVKRSNGVFGKSGTGKTFLTRLLLIGLIQKGSALNLVFDMHNEYGWEGPREDGRKVKGLKQLFPSRVVVCSLDEASSRRRGLSPDFLVRIGMEEIEPQDIQILRETLNLSEVAAAAAYDLERHYGRPWLKSFLDEERPLKELASDLGVNPQALGTLHNRLRRLERFPFISRAPVEDAVARILEYLDRGMHVVLEFGRYGDDLTAYILVANLITRRIHERYKERKELAMGEKGEEPRPLVITIEEAHKFLNPQVASQTIFGTIAREMRKYNVTLLIVDQRPSSIDSEVLSQIGTKVTCLMDDDRDIEAVLTGAPEARELRTVLAKLESKQQVLFFGHAVPMPVVLRVREYGSASSYRELALEAGDRGESRGIIEELWG